MKQRIVPADRIKDEVSKLLIKANTVLRPDVFKCIKILHANETSPRAKNMLKILIENAEIAKKEKIAICQDTGMACVFIDLGADVKVRGDLLNAVNAGVKEAYLKGNFRKSVVCDPILRKNTNTNTPAVIHVDIVKGDRIKISVMPKGFGSENKGKIFMLNPTVTRENIVDICVNAIKQAGPDACPPYVVGIGLGGTMERSAYLAKKALLGALGERNRKKHIALIEREIISRANGLKIGVMGLGGRSTVMDVKILEDATHIAGLPLAINFSCHALRSASEVI
ncbi:MAG TPA: fumarate hydratase [Candidatus Omnitrophota bacterium]|nr:fumarate hydratase [Candidatus Omnitrophota bacterium]HPS20508.1 fumarate hydratase [Candidatus Omnitrophota bacterium]